MRSGIVSLILAFSSSAVNAMPTILTSPDHRSGTRVTRDQGQEIIWYFLIPDGAKFVNDNHAGAQRATEILVNALLAHDGTPRRKTGTADFVGDPDHFNFEIESSAKIDSIDCPCRGHMDLDETTGGGVMKLEGQNAHISKPFHFGGKT